MSEIINLNRARKARARATAGAAAASNRGLHGLTKAEKQAAKAERDRAARLVDGHRLERRDPDATDQPESGRSE
ncbi:DUF4169 family protein [Brevundimonas variabilis]|uniref:RecB family exonuclease n=1 Tax=Brevundimonas variabilis TaxID=74312 RepID=A0A7W9CJ42_9CAUL|nr:RecB family exonuclease [Brevundimonas variabilis]